MVAGQLTDIPNRGLVNSRTGQLADWTTRGSCLGQLADWLKFPFVL